MNDEKALTYEEAKQLCELAFDGGVTYGEESMRYCCNATAYDWEHWLKGHEHLFRPKPTVEDVLDEIVDKANNVGCAYASNDMGGDEMMDALKAIITEFAPRLRLKED